MSTAPKPSQETNPTLKEHWQSFLEGVQFLFKVLRILFTIAVIGFFVIGGYKLADVSGWISHSKDTEILLSQNWILGEYRHCDAAPDKEGAIMWLVCTKEFDESKPSSHTMPVRYWGQIKRQDVVARVQSSGSWEWRCQRKSESVTCWAIN